MAAAAHVDAAAMLLRNLLAHPETEASADMWLGGEERIENLAKCGGAHACSGVGNAEPDARDVGCGMVPVASADHQPPVRGPGHRADGVGDEIGDHLAQFIGIGRERDRLALAALDGDAFVLDSVLVEREN